MLFKNNKKINAYLIYNYMKIIKNKKNEIIIYARLELEVHFEKIKFLKD